MITRLMIVAIVFVLSLLPCSGQQATWEVPRSAGERINEPSPEAVAMRRYQDFPVSYATGTADVSISLADLPCGSIGVSLGGTFPK